MAAKECFIYKSYEFIPLNKKANQKKIRKSNINATTTWFIPPHPATRHLIIAAKHQNNLLKVNISLILKISHRTRLIKIISFSLDSKICSLKMA